MSDTETIKNFLIELGIKTDEPGLKRFGEGMASVTKYVLGLGVAITAVATEVVIGVSRMAANLEGLYFASKRTNTTVTNLKSLDLAAQNFGASAGEAQASAEGLAKYLRENPGGEHYLGVTTRDAKGDLRDMTDIMVDMGKRWSTMPKYLSSQFAHMYGISDNMYLALMNGDFERNLNQVRGVLNNAGYDKASADAHEYEESLRLIEARFDAIKMKIGHGIFTALKPELDELGDWLDKHSDQIDKNLENFVLATETAAKYILPILSKIAEGWRLIYDTVKDAGKAIADALPTKTADDVGGAFGWLLNKLGIQDQADKDLGVNGHADQAAPNSGEPRSNAITLLSGGTADSPPQLPESKVMAQWIRDIVNAIIGKSAQAQLYFEQRGWSSAQAQGIVANLQAESGLDEHRVGDHGHAQGLAQWQEPRQFDFKKWAGIDLKDSSFEQQLAFIEEELTQGRYKDVGRALHSAATAPDATRLFSLQYERPLAGAEEANRRAAAVTMTQNTSITMNGVHDPAAAGRAVADQQDRVNANVVRNIKTPVQ